MQWIEDSINNKLLKLYEYEDFKEVNKIYDGYCLEIYSAVYKSCRVAIKSLLSDNNECINEIVREIQLYRQFNYCSISKIYGVTRKGKDKPFSLVLEFAENGEMIEYFRNSCQTIYMDDFVNIIVQIARLILILHEEDIFGINISSNILLDKKRRVKLSSLGLSNRILKSFQSKNQDIIDFKSIFKVIKFKDGKYNKLLKDCINTRSLEDCINRLESVGRSTKGREVEIVVGKKRKKPSSTINLLVLKRLKYDNKNSIASRVKLNRGESIGKRVKDRHIKMKRKK